MEEKEEEETTLGVRGTCVGRESVYMCVRVREREGGADRQTGKKSVLIHGCIYVYMCVCCVYVCEGVCLSSKY